MKKDDHQYYTTQLEFHKEFPVSENYYVEVRNPHGRVVVRLFSKEQTSVELAAEAVASALNKVMK